MKYLNYIFALLFLIALTSSIFITIKPVSEICSPNEACDLVLNSKYSYHFGIKNSYYGIVIFSILTLIIISQIKNPSKSKKNIINSGIIISSIIAAYFLYLQHFVIKAYCKYCLIVDISIIISLIILIISLKWKKS